MFSSELLWGLGELRHIKCLVAYSKCSLNTSFVMAQGPHPLIDDLMLCLGLTNLSPFLTQDIHQMLEGASSLVFREKTVSWLPLGNMINLHVSFPFKG